MDSYYGRSTGRLDTVRVEADNEQTSAKTNDKKTTIWFPRVVAYVPVSWNQNDEQECTTYGTIHYLDSELNWKYEMAFALWFEAVDDQNLPIDKIDTVLKSFWLR